MKNNLSELLNKDMTRHEFLATVGLGLVSVLGFSSALKFLMGDSSTRTVHHRHASGGYGATPYGR